MMRRIHIKILIVLSISLFSSYSYLSAQERVETREEARQHYQQGKEFYSQGRYQDATVEFEKAIALETPEMLFQDKIQREQGKAFAPESSQEATTGFKSATTLETPEILFQDKIQREQGKILAPQQVSPEATQPKKELVEKEEEEDKEKNKEEKEAEVIKPLVIEKEPEPEIQEREYYIDLGDVLDISVWQVADLSRSEVIVRPDGKISLPLIGDIKAEGLTLTKLDDVVTEKLKVYVKIPEVSVMIRRFGEQSNKIVILGEVPAPGVYRFSGPPSIVEAIASSGGYTKYAVLSSIMIIRGDVTRIKPKVTRVNFAQIIKSGRVSENIFLRPNDIVYVPRSFIGNINTFIEIFQPAISEYLQTMNARYLHNIVREQ